MLLHADQLTKDYGRFRALDRLDLSLTPGEIVGLLGPNGSGKSTAIRLLLGFLRPSAGRATIDGHDCWTDSAAARRAVSYLPGELRLYENMTGQQLVDFLLHLRGQSAGSRVERMARDFDVDMSRPVLNLSSGMKRKLALLAVLAPETPLVILDEPTNTLDPNMRDLLLAQLTAARGRGQTVLFSSHVLNEVERVCDRVAILQAGKLVHRQALAELRALRTVRATLTGPAEALPALPGLEREPTSQTDGELILHYAGPLPELLAWLARQPVRDLAIEPQGLGPIYRRFHPHA